jgi:hypothetical protein
MATSKKQTLEQKIENAAEAFEARANTWSDKTFKRWVGSTEILLGLTNTYARWLITILSYAVLIGWGFYSLYFEDAAVGYAIALLVCFVLQAASVRFIFRWDEISDEYQSKRRDAAYRKAYRSIRQIFVLVAVFWFLSTFVAGYIYDHSGISFQAPLHMDTYRSAVVAIFLVGLMTLQKYASYGMKGEPFISVAEYRRQRNS